MMFKTRTPDAEWMDRLRERQYTDDTVFPDPELEGLKRKLLTFGGSAVVLAFPEPDLEKIMTRAEIEIGDNPIMLTGERNNCHENAFRLWRGDPTNVRLCTGWALSDDGLWRQHSWAKMKGRIVETTIQRVAYFGFELTDKEAREWSSAP